MHEGLLSLVYWMSIRMDIVMHLVLLPPETRTRWYSALVWLENPIERQMYKLSKVIAY